MKTEQSGEREDHPEHARREVDGAHRRRIPREIENGDRQQREYERSEKRAARAKFDRQILASDEGGGCERPGRNARAHRVIASRYTSRYASSSTSPRGSCVTNRPSRMMAVCDARASPSPRWWV